MDNDERELDGILDQLKSQLRHPGWITIHKPGQSFQAFHVCEKGNVPVRAKFLHVVDNMLVCPRCLAELEMEDVYSKMPQFVVTGFPQPAQ